MLPEMKEPRRALAVVALPDGIYAIGVCLILVGGRGNILIIIKEGIQLI